ncbi:MAG: META domain-containing protein [Planctomycetes bacterium]|nr:META domain-containing protein [Planctomycetota bacterium]
MKLLVLMAGLFLGLCGLGAGGDISAADLMGNRFVLHTVDGESPEWAAGVHMEFDDSLQMAGRICNTFRGQGETVDGILRLKQGISTRMLCFNEDLSRLENFLLGSLEIGLAASLADGFLTLRGADTVLIFQEGEVPPEPSAPAPEDGVILRRLDTPPAPGIEIRREPQPDAKPAK